MTQDDYVEIAKLIRAMTSPLCQELAALQKAQLELEQLREELQRVRREYPPVTDMPVTDVPIKPAEQTADRLIAQLTVKQVLELLAKEPGIDEFRYAAWDANGECWLYELEPKYNSSRGTWVTQPYPSGHCDQGDYSFDMPFEKLHVPPKLLLDPAASLIDREIAQVF